MTDFTHLQSLLTEHFPHNVTHVYVRRENELHCHISRGDAPRLAEILRAEFNAELTLMAANDRRAGQGVFEIHYLARATAPA